MAYGHISWNIGDDFFLIFQQKQIKKNFRTLNHAFSFQFISKNRTYSSRYSNPCLHVFTSEAICPHH